MTAYDSIERDAADVVERRHRRTFTLTQLLVACGAVCVCTLAATTTVVNTHLANFDEDSALANFDDGSAFDDDSALDDGSAFDDDSALANFVDDYPEGAQLGQGNLTDRQKRCLKHYTVQRVLKFKCYNKGLYGGKLQHCLKRATSWANLRQQKCTAPSPPPSPPPPPPPLGSYVRTVLPKGPLSRGSACYYPRGFYYKYSSRWKDCEEKCDQCGDCVGVFYNGRFKRCYFAKKWHVWFQKPN